MSTPALRWFAACHRTVLAAGRQRLLDTILGPVRVADDCDRPPPLSWPPSGVLPGCRHPPFGTLVITTQEPPDEITEPLQSRQALSSGRTGRGAFPVRWLPGHPWIARCQDGPLVMRDGNDVLMAAATDTDAATWASKVLREMLIHGGRSRGFRLCHCAVIGGQRSGLLITGPSGAGKTDLALKLARRLQAGVITVDRGIVGSLGADLAAGTLPFGLNIHRDTLADLGCLDSALVRQYPPQNGKHYLDVPSAQRLVQITMSARARITAVVALQPAAGATRWQRLDTAVAARTLLSADVAGRDPGYQIDWLGMGTGKAAPPLSVTDMITGWVLSYRPDHPLPHAWTAEVAEAVRSQACGR
jgi:hypothetical protein